MTVDRKATSVSFTQGKTGNLVDSVKQSKPHTVTKSSGKVHTGSHMAASAPKPQKFGR
jgi:hypothetical protein